jgi:hypothetical protein
MAAVNAVRSKVCLGSLARDRDERQRQTVQKYYRIILTTQKQKLGKADLDQSSRQADRKVGPEPKPSAEAAALSCRLASNLVQ